MNKKQLMNQKIDGILIAIHRGFLSDEDNKATTNKEVLDNVPKDSLASKDIGNDNYILTLSPFTRKWVKKAVKKDPDVTAEQLLRSVGFSG